MLLTLTLVFYLPIFIYFWVLFLHNDVLIHLWPNTLRAFALTTKAYSISFIINAINYYISYLLLVVYVL